MYQIPHYLRRAVRIRAVISAPLALLVKLDRLAAEGHLSGILNGTCVPSRFSGTASRASGLYPGFSENDRVSDHYTRSRMKSRLWSVALETVVPASFTGSSTAFGVRIPVRPTCMTISVSFVSFSSGGNL